MPPTTASDFSENYIAAAVASGDNGTGAFGMRLMYDTVKPLMDRLTALNGSADDITQLDRTFGPVRFIALSREDLVAQAVSLTIAEQSGLWHRNADGSVLEQTQVYQDPTYDHEAIAKEYVGLQADAAGWEAWFAANGIKPLRVTYEALSADPLNTLASCLTHIGLDPAIAQTCSPGTAKLATARNHAWAVRFRKEAGLPPPPIRS